MAGLTFSVIIPVYRNEASLPRLLDTLRQMNQRLGDQLEAVFVVDGSPDQCFSILRNSVDNLGFPAQLAAHSRNFGSFAAVRSGLALARGQFFGVMAADLQEPPELLIAFFEALQAHECDVAIGTRSSRGDSWRSRVASGLFWGLYKKLVVPDMPEGGVDVFGCNMAFRNELLRLEESRSSLIALIFWLGFRRKLVAYDRLVRQEGTSGWTLRKKIDYMMDSIFAFTDLPIRLLVRIGVIGSCLSLALGALTMAAHFAGAISVPGYAATMLVTLFFGMLNLLGLGLVGTYAWRAYENTKHRPAAVVAFSYKTSTPL